MDLSKFRRSGDLSDVTVVVGEENYRLHKFPLFARSEFFSMMTRNSEGGTNQVELEDFPGGHGTFEIVADFCYNINIEVTRENVVELRSAAHFLQMEGAGNLSEVAEKFFHDAITSAKLKRSTDVVSEFLDHCVSTGAISERVGIVDECVDALLECWLRPTTMFTSPTHSPRPLLANSNQNATLYQSLTRLPAEWFLKILSKGKEKCVDPSYLVSVTGTFLSAALSEDETTRETSSREKADNESAEKNDCDTDDQGSSETPTPEKLKSKKTNNKKLAELLDMILLELPADISLAGYVSADWVIRCLKIATANNCKCTTLLIRAAGELFKTLSPDELCSMSPSTIQGIITESIAFKPEEDVYSSSCALLDLYFLILTEKSQLTSDTFKELAKTVPPEHRECDDQLYIALEFVLKSEKDSLSTETRKELIDMVNFRCVDDSILERALEEDLVPAETIARVAVERCRELRAELNSSRVSEHPEDNDRYGYDQGYGYVARPSRPPPVPRCNGGQSNPSDPEYGQMQDDERSRTVTNGLSYGPMSSRLPERDNKGDLDSVPTRVKTVPPYAYRPIRDSDRSYGDDQDFRLNQAFWGSGNLRTPRSSYPYSYHHHRTYTHRI